MQDNPHKQARKELRELVISGRHAFNIEAVVLADLHREKVEDFKGDEPIVKLEDL